MDCVDSWIVLGWVGSTIAKVLKILKDYVIECKARVNKLNMYNDQ